MKKISLLFCILFCKLGCLGYSNNNITLENIVHNNSSAFNLDAKVVIIYAYAQTPGGPGINGDYEIIYAIVTNIGTQTLTNLPVTININGVDPFTHTTLLTFLNPGDTGLVPLGQHDITTTGLDTVTVSVPNDDDNTNNSLSLVQENTLGIYSYADSSTPTGSVGFGAGSGIITTKYIHHGVCRITAVRVHISNDPENIGKTVYAVALVGGVTIISQSANTVLTAADLGKYKLFPVSPNPLNSGQPVWVGLAQTAGSTPYYPVSTQAETPTRWTSFYRRNLPGVLPDYLLQDSSHGRYMIQAILNNVVVPVQLQSFAAKRNGAVNELAWVTAQEINSKEFIIERSNDGISFTRIGHVPASGNSSTVFNYHFTDSHPIKGMNYYRLRSVDMDGAFKLSEIRTVKNLGDLDLAVYPNPVKDIINIEINAMVACKGMLSITDMVGKKIFSLPVNVNAGSNIIKMNAGNLLPAVYVIQLQLNSRLLVKQFIKM